MIRLITNEAANFEQCADKIPLIQHEKWEELDIARCKELESEEGNITSVGGCDANGNELEIPYDVVKESVKEVGLDGFADTEKNEIHYWVNREVVTDGNLIDFASHELTHLSEPFIIKHAQMEDETLRSELLAEMISQICGTAIVIANRIKEG